MNCRQYLSCLIFIAFAGCSASGASSVTPAASAPESAGRLPAAKKDQRFAVLTAFQNSKFMHPLAKVTFDGSGNLYGTASTGESPYECGGIFEIAQSGTETDLYGFNSTNACGPAGAVSFDAGGDIFGTASNAVYEVTSGGSERLIEALGGGTEGGFSDSDLAQDSEGNFYGTASEGGYFRGACSYPPVGCGVVFKVTPGGKYSVIHEFRGNDGDRPYAGVTFGKDGNLYGTTGFGGAVGWGEVYRMTTAGKVTVLYSFKHSDDGALPYSVPVLDASGNVYGTTQEGGWNGNQQCDSGCGVVFKVTPTGKESSLHKFTSTPDGQFPFAGLYLDSHGTLYGTTKDGGAEFAGTVFEISTAGKQYHILHAFTDGSDGAFPVAALVVDTSGALYGTASGGGIGAGTVFKIAP